MGSCGVTTLSGVGNEKVISECPRGARKALKDCSGNEAVRSRGEDLVSTLSPVNKPYGRSRVA